MSLLKPMLHEYKTMVLYYLLKNYRPEGMPQRRGRRHYGRSVEKNIVRISTSPFLHFSGARLKKEV